MKSTPTAWPLILCHAAASACCPVHLAAAHSCAAARESYRECAG